MALKTFFINDQYNLRSVELKFTKIIFGVFLNKFGIVSKIPFASFS